MHDEDLGPLMRERFSDACTAGERSELGDQTTAAFLNRHPELGEACFLRPLRFGVR